MALIVSEIGKAIEALRTDAISDKIPTFNGIEEELANTIIRIMDVAQARGWRVAEAIVAKHEYNATRPMRHGGKRY